MSDESAAPEEAQADPNTLSLEAREYDTIGPVHCGVTREGLVAVGARQIFIEDGEEQVAEHVGIAVKRAGDKYTFTKTA